MSPLRIVIADPTGRTSPALSVGWVATVEADGLPPEVGLRFSSGYGAVDIPVRVAPARSPANPMLDLISACQPMPDELARFIRACSPATPDHLTVGLVSERLGVPRRTLAYRFHRLGLPAPHLVLDACRLVAGAHAIGRCGETVESAALADGFGSPSGFRRMLRRVLALSTAGIRGPSGWERVVAAFDAFVRRSSG